ncbi:hypothetical protein ACGFIY_27750 [Micromonospora chersina]|uniref:hypothetical protein n=1 Tax=Micromonospora chersina TaxID=47854 RepID=UPI003715380E
MSWRQIQELLFGCERCRGYRSIPVVVFTTSSIDADVLASYTAHANAYITKPINTDEFQRVVGQIHRFYGRTATLPPGPRAD